MILKGYLFSILYGAICLVVAALLHKASVPKKVTRKLVHILVGFEWVILYRYVGVSIHFLAVCLIFLALLTVAYKKNLMPMIESDSDNAPGTVYYGAAMSIMATVMLFVPDMIIPFGVGVFCTSVGDGLAGLVGQSIPSKINPKVYGEKSLAGATVNFVTCFGVALLFSEYFGMGIGFAGCIAIAIFALELELFTGRGLDNITITLGSAFLSFALSNFESVWEYMIPILLTPFLIAFVRKKQALSLGGTLAAAMLDTVVSVSLGNSGFLILLSFLVFGLVADKLKKRAEKSGQSEKRGLVQVFSNGGIAAALSVLYLIYKEEAFAVAFCASLAEALADTSASGIGAFSESAFDIFRMRKCERGLSGGVSLIGTFAALVGASVIALISLTLGVVSLSEALIVIVAGFLGCAFDSLLGSLLQVKYRCTKCGKITEKISHCDVSTEYYRGLKFVDNNAVNLLGTFFAALVAILSLKAFI